ncbi:MAG: PKD domain-containing protein, partial [Bacteroidia bacterium]|nr:PKD domain-containing protein [Bacteroidia bacterium]
MNLFKKYIFAVLCVVCVFASAQLETMNWYFGSYAGLTFTSNPPTALSNGALTTSEGCSTISDAAGNLLFYTDGSNVYTSTHTVMANGSGLSGFSSSSQSGVIVKQPGSASLYYVFTQGATLNGLKYSIVDMTLSSGQGSVVTKNAVLQASSSEKLTAVRHCNGVDFWILTHDQSGGNYYAFLLSSAGVNTTAVVSSVGITYSNGDYIGILKTSPNGKKLADGLYGVSGTYQLSDFDNSTGLVSNSFTLGSGFSLAYGVEFSPDGSKLYGTRYANNNVYQWDLCAGTATAIVNSIYSVASSGTSKGALQLALDGKIYIARSAQSDLAVIASPNSSGSSCNYTEQGQSISPKTSSWGLPNFITSSIKPPTPPFTYTVSNSFGCQAAAFTSPTVINTFTANLCSTSGYSLSGILWNFGDPASGANNTSGLQNPSHAFTSLGTYTVTEILYFSCGGGTDTIRQVININQPCISVASTSITCANLGSATVQATGGIGPFSYTWMPTGQTNSVATGLSPGSYTLTVYDFGNNFTYTAQTVFTSLIPLTGNINMTSSVSCNGAATGTGNITNIAGGSGNQTYLWTNGSVTYTTNNVNSLSAGIWTTQAKDVLTGCQFSLVSLVTQPPAMNLVLSSNTPTACAGRSITLSGLNSGG